MIIYNDSSLSQEFSKSDPHHHHHHHLKLVCFFCPFIKASSIINDQMFKGQETFFDSSTLPSYHIYAQWPSNKHHTDDVNLSVFYELGRNKSLFLKNLKSLLFFNLNRTLKKTFKEVQAELSLQWNESQVKLTKID